MNPHLDRAPARSRLLLAALSVVRTKGYAATSVDDLCAAAGATKGAFFHHFKSKEDLAVAAADLWSDRAAALFAAAPYHAYPDPLDRVLGYLDFRKSLLVGAPCDYTCLVGTMVQEVHDSHPAIRDACARSIARHAATVAEDIDAAMRVHAVPPGWTAASLALHVQAVLQGGFILAKAQDGADAAIAAIDHLRRYVELLFGRAANITRGLPS